MMKRRKKNENKKWLLAGLVPIAVGAIIQFARLLMRRRTPSRTYPMSSPPAETGFEGAYARITPGLVPVTAPKKGQRRPSGGKGAARVYEVQRMPDPSRALPPPSDEERGRFPWLLASALVLILVGFTVFSMLGSRPARPQVVTVPGGDVEAGRQAIQSWGCGSCHTIPGIPGAYGKVGPKLDQMAEQTYIAGMLPNTPDNLMRWIMYPQEIQPGNAMPNTNVQPDTARHMAAYLYSIR